MFIRDYAKVGYSFCDGCGFERGWHYDENYESTCENCGQQLISCMNIQRRRFKTIKEVRKLGYDFDPNFVYSHMLDNICTQCDYRFKCLTN